ncbi:MAG: hypothetical protein UV66_C0003G0017 [Candidatus Woesebacteria bacterium GW2011_GWA1_43_12]|uniref:Bacterial membrane protein YfhO n=2 Tax=Microgenomates group TaxID=1794810 RepID=A0A0G1CY89_9BACT|nr:MAG: hypothetical protein UV66_C0003G0017 [Candidatus Woesebacteria bacterium GW2011_GWA1_43_12]
MGVANKKCKMKILKLFQKFWPVLIIGVVWFIFASPYFLKGLAPFPSKYLVTFFAPWSASYGMPLKNNAMPDVITQIYPWKRLTIDTWRQGQIPLWNPYSFAGTQHAGNYQTAVFSPFNLLFFLTSEIDAWSLLVLLQPLLAGIFMYIFLRSLERSEAACVVGSTAFMFCGFLVVWMAYATLGYAALWLPLILFAIHRQFVKPSWWHLLLVSVGLALSFLSGHFQISLYVSGLVLCYIFAKTIATKQWRVGGMLLLFFAFGIGLSVPQFTLTFNAFEQSVRSTNFMKGEVIPWQYLITLLAPDFFGNPVTRNDWFGHYAEWAGYIGVVPLFLALYAIIRKKAFQVLFFAIAGIATLALALPTPLNDLIYALKIPVLGTSGASRIIVLFSFCLATLASFGFDAFLSDRENGRRKWLTGLAMGAFLVVALLWASVLLGSWLTGENKTIAMRNLLLPTAILVITIVLTQAGFSRKKYIRLIVVGALVGLVAFDMLRFASKWMPFDPKGFVYPKQKLLEYLNPKQIGYYRVFGNIGNEVGTMFGVPLIEGYDAMYQGRYGEFIGTAADGTIKSPQRSVVLIDRQGRYTEDALQLLGVRYVVHRISDGQNVWAFPFWKYPHYRSSYRDEHFEVLENTQAYLRTFLASSYILAASDQEVIDRLWSTDFFRKTTLVLEQEPEIKPAEGEGTSAISKYSPTEVIIEVKTSAPKLLFLSDTYEKGWKVTVDGKITPLYRADYAFRAVGVPTGEHIVRFFYDPPGFGISLLLAGISMMALVVGSVKKIYEDRHL